MATEGDKILLITNTLHAHPRGGRELLCKLNYQALLESFSDGLRVLELKKMPKIGFRGYFRALAGHIDGVDSANITRMLELIANEGIKRVFIDGSNLGELARQLRKAYPALDITVFFHNVEAVFFWDSFKEMKSFRALAVCSVNYLSERKSVLYSNRRICLSGRDSGALRQLYGTSGTDVSAIALIDNYTQQHHYEVPIAKYALFVGGLFYANLSGIRWYAKNVAPTSPILTIVVGRGLLDYKEELERYGGIEVVGEVVDVEPWYRNAQFVVAPIFGGSGMKTKVAEALMFGKRVIGTPEAFSGYEAIANRVGLTCETAPGFLDAITAMCKSEMPDFDQTLRIKYLTEFSYNAAKDRLKAIMAPSAVAVARKNAK